MTMSTFLQFGKVIRSSSTLRLVTLCGAISPFHSRGLRIKPSHAASRAEKMHWKIMLLLSVSWQLRGSVVFFCHRYRLFGTYFLRCSWVTWVGGPRVWLEFKRMERGWKVWPDFVLADRESWTQCQQASRWFLGGHDERMMWNGVHAKNKVDGWYPGSHLRRNTEPSWRP